ncbi:MAG TPA: SPFH domain-containing protein [Candidatus Paceibacterota bacterium]
MNTRVKRIMVLALAGTMTIGGLAACSSIAPPDEVGLYYMEGPVDGYKFDHCYDPGATTDYEWNNSTVLLPNSLRTWNIAPPNTPGADSNSPIVVNSKPEADQPSGVQVSLWMQTNFALNTYCGSNNDDANSPIVQFWEKIGRRYQADQPDGWKAMLSSTIVTALETSARSVVRGYTADALVSGQQREEVQIKIAGLFQDEIKRVSGGEFFCAPTFDRKAADQKCGEVQILLKDVDYTNAGIQAARDEKQAAVERAAALVAEAQGKVDAAAKTGSLYNNPAWVELEMAKIKLEQVKACASNPNCTVVITGAGDVMVGTK